MSKRIYPRTYLTDSRSAMVLCSPTAIGAAKAPNGTTLWLPTFAAATTWMVG